MDALKCIKCGEQNVFVSMCPDHEFHCVECDEYFTLDDVRELVESWGRVIKWIDASPFKCEQPKPTAEVKVA